MLIKYKVSLEYQKPDRNVFGHPIFGTEEIEVDAYSESKVMKKLDSLYGQGNYNVITINPIEV